MYVLYPLSHFLNGLIYCRGIGMYADASYTQPKYKMFFKIRTSIKITLCTQMQGHNGFRKSHILDLCLRGHQLLPGNIQKPKSIQTSQLQRLAPNHGDIRFNVEVVPSTVCLYKCFKITCCIFNNSERTLELELNLENVNKPRILWTGCVSKKLGLVEPSGSIEVVLEAVAQSPGLQSLSGIRLIDSLLMRTYQFDDICHIYVVKDKRNIV